MIFKLKKGNDQFLEKAYADSMSELNDFFGIDWTEDIPTVITVDGRAGIDMLRREKTEPHTVGWVSNNGRIIYILDRENFESESNHTYGDDAYRAILKHELVHAFHLIMSKGATKPVWLWEGTAIFVSGQNRFKKPVERYAKFLDSYDCHRTGVYAESGFFVENLVTVFGKHKLFDLIKESKEAGTRDEFDSLFSSIFGFELGYESINAWVRHDAGPTRP